MDNGELEKEGNAEQEENIRRRKKIGQRKGKQTGRETEKIIWRKCHDGETKAHYED